MVAYAFTDQGLHRREDSVGGAGGQPPTDASLPPPPGDASLPPPPGDASLPPPPGDASLPPPLTDALGKSTGCFTADALVTLPDGTVPPNLPNLAGPSVESKKRKGEENAPAPNAKLARAPIVVAAGEGGGKGSVMGSSATKADPNDETQQAKIATAAMQKDNGPRERFRYELLSAGFTDGAKSDGTAVQKPKRLRKIMESGGLVSARDLLDAGRVRKAIHALQMKTKAMNEHRTAYMEYLEMLVSKEELTQEELKLLEKAIPVIPKVRDPAADTSAATASAPLAPATAPAAAGSTSMIPPVHEAGSSSMASPVQEAHETIFIQDID